MGGVEPKVIGSSPGLAGPVVGSLGPPEGAPGPADGSVEPVTDVALCSASAPVLGLALALSVGTGDVVTSPGDGLTLCSDDLLFWSPGREDGDPPGVLPPGDWLPPAVGTPVRAGAPTS